MGALYYHQNDIGDINNDELIDIIDVILLINLILDDTYNSTADINSDGTLNVQDAILLINLILNS